MYAPDRLLEHLLTELANADLLGGDNMAPEEGGWVNGQPQSGYYKPYTVLMLQQSSPGESLTHCVEWTTQFSVRHFAASRRQLSWQANKAHVALLRPWVDHLSDWQSSRTRWAAFGSVQRVDTTDPPFWQAYDALEVRVSAKC